MGAHVLAELSDKRWQLLTVLSSNYAHHDRKTLCMLANGFCYHRPLYRRRKIKSEYPTYTLRTGDRSEGPPSPPTPSHSPPPSPHTHPKSQILYIFLGFGMVFIVFKDLRAQEAHSWPRVEPVPISVENQPVPLCLPIFLATIIGKKRLGISAKTPISKGPICSSVSD